MLRFALRQDMWDWEGLSEQTRPIFGDLAEFTDFQRFSVNDIIQKVINTRDLTNVSFTNKETVDSIVTCDAVFPTVLLKLIAGYVEDDYRDFIDCFNSVWNFTSSVFPAGETEARVCQTCESVTMHATISNGANATGTGNAVQSCLLDCHPHSA